MKTIGCKDKTEFYLPDSISKIKRNSFVFVLRNNNRIQDVHAVTYCCKLETVMRKAFF